MFSKKTHCAPHFTQKFIAQTKPSRIIPQLRLMQIRFRVRTDDDSPTHRRGLRNLASTSSHDEPASGFVRYSSSSRSNIAFSSVEGSKPFKSANSSISQMRSKIS